MVLGKRARDDAGGSDYIPKRSRASTIEPAEGSVLNYASSNDDNCPDLRANQSQETFLKDLSNFIPLGSLTFKLSKFIGADVHDKYWKEAHPDYNRGGLWYALQRDLAAREKDFAITVKQLSRIRRIRIFAREHRLKDDLATMRVFLLPDDVGRRFMIHSTWSGDKDLRTCLPYLLRHLDPSLDAWKGIDLNDLQSNHHGVETEDEASLFYLFNSLQSPDPQPLPISCQTSSHAIQSALNPEGLRGLNTQLYPFQKRTVATMIKREVEPARVLDPRFCTLKSPTGQVFYYDNVSLKVHVGETNYNEARGGILGESMGLGKTLICLAVILATQGHWPGIPPQFRAHPHVSHPKRPNIGSLMEMAATAANRSLIPWRAKFRNNQECLRHLVASAPSYYVTPLERKHRSRSLSSLQERIVYMAFATLIIVPQNLLNHWKSEIAKHVEYDYLNVLSLDTNDSVRIVSVQELQSYDIILMSRPRFEKEMSTCESVDGSYGTKRQRGGCACDLDGQCDCSATKYESPLGNVHFLRVIMDEGHEFSSSGRGSAFSWAMRSLRADRKWIVSGTPANGLFGVEIGTATFETSSKNYNKIMTQKLLQMRKKESALTQERKDLESLGLLVTGFLQVQPWSNSKEDDPASWHKYIMPSKSGQRKARSLKKLLESLVVRHRIEDVEAEIKLPPLHNRVVYLQPSWHDKIRINLFIVNLIVNAVTSERTDADYMFHSKNRKELNTLINNLRQSGFYWTGISRAEISKTLEIACAYLDKQKDQERSWNGADKTLLEDAAGITVLALASPSWRSLTDVHEMGMFVEHFPEKARRTWSIIEPQGTDLLLTGATQLAKAQKWVDSHLYVSDIANDLAGVGLSTMRHVRALVHPNGDLNLSEKSEKDAQQHVKGNPRSRPYTNLTGVPKLTSGRTVSRPKVSLDLQRKPADTLKPSGLKPSLKSALKTSRAPVDLLPKDSPLAKARLCGTTSAKLSYLLDKVTMLHENEKILIFYDGDHIAWYIAQALDLIGIRYLIYTRLLPLDRRTAYITTFNTTETFRVLLMNVHQAAHGLHIASASRVFFVNPVWQPNVEAQAIKRAHRIGQTRPVYVETLVLKDTLEDQMLQRRKGMTPQEHQKAERSLLDDQTMSGIIKRAQFVELKQTEVDHVNSQVARLQIPQQLFARETKGEGDVNDPDADLIFPGDDDAPTPMELSEEEKQEEEENQEEDVSQEEEENQEEENQEEEGETSTANDTPRQSQPPKPRRVYFHNAGKVVCAIRKKPNSGTVRHRKGKVTWN